MPTPAPRPATPAPHAPQSAVLRLWVQPILVALVVAATSGLALLVLVTGVLTSGGGFLLIAGVLGVATLVLAAALGLLLRSSGVGSPWSIGLVLAVVDLGVFLALLVTGTQRFSIVMLRPELSIAAVALTTGAASLIVVRGPWRIVGIAGVVCLAWLALTPVLVAL